MKPEAEAYLAKARTCLMEADANVTIGLAGIVGRQAYYAAFHAAHAYVFELAGLVPRTHRGLHSTFLERLRSDGRLPLHSGRVLAEGYELKAKADYDLAAHLTMDNAVAVLAHARAFVDAVEGVLAPSESGPSELPPSA